jgi:hypothetical protein
MELITIFYSIPFPFFTTFKERFLAPNQFLIFTLFVNDFTYLPLCL